MSPAAIGLRAHSGWAAAAALAGPAGRPVVVMRRRIEMRERGAAGPAQPYHAAAQLGLDEARAFLERFAADATSLAAEGLRGLAEDLRGLGHRTAGCGLLLASGRPLPPLDRILVSHPLLHAAEGELFRAALRDGARQGGLPVVEAKERDLFARAAAALRITKAAVEQHVQRMGRDLGPPWRQDEKLASVAAWLALAAAA
jgi:hypothetical protein